MRHIFKQSPPDLLHVVDISDIEKTKLKSEDCDEKSACTETLSDTNSSMSSSSLDSGSEARATWGRKLEFFLSCVSYAVGLGNIWRFPYLCFKNGGGAFLIPYLCFLLLCGMPMFFLEISFGQFASLSPISIWRICPLVKGIGYGMVIVSGIVCIYYNVIIAWVVYFLFHSFRFTLPWSTCDNWWNTEFCVLNKNKNSTMAFNNSVSSNYSDFSQNLTNIVIGTAKNFSKGDSCNGTEPKWRTASEEFWERNVLQITDGVDDMGSMRWELVACLAVAWTFVFLCMFKGVKSSGKVVYFTATFPYAVLFILLIRGLTLPGAINGIKFYIIPDFEKLGKLEVWGEAAMQIFYSIGTAWGGLITMASYNKFNHNCYRNALVIPLMNSGTSIFAGFVIFSILGFMAHETGSAVEDVVKGGPGLIFVVYPEAVAKMPISPLWSILFFAMVFTVGLGTQFGMFETMTSAFIDEYPQLLKGKKTLIVLVACLIEFCFGLPCITQGGMYVLQIMDWYSSTFSLMIICLLEAVVISWVYGLDRFIKDIELMIGYKPCIWWKITWGFITPLLIICIFTFNVVSHTPVSYGECYKFPQWSVAIGWMLATVSIIPIPGFAVYVFCQQKGSLLERIKSVIRPAPEWGPAEQKNRQLYITSLPPAEQSYVVMSLRTDETMSNAVVESSMSVV